LLIDCLGFLVVFAVKFIVMAIGYTAADENSGFSPFSSALVCSCYQEYAGGKPFFGKILQLLTGATGRDCLTDIMVVTLSQ